MNTTQLIESLNAVLAEGRKGPDDAFTTREWARMLGVNEVTARRYIRTALEMGAMSKTQKTIEDMRGIMQPVRAYQLLTDG